jgi:hypothetical protein|tara:strand:+ start:3460 stop:3666 length:207 start_codon:yes stop_codon:yes gene_type:complete
MLAIGRAGVVMLLIGLAILAVVYQQTKSGVNMPELQHISLILGILIIGGFLMMMQGIKVHGRRHGWFR